MWLQVSSVVVFLSLTLKLPQCSSPSKDLNYSKQRYTISRLSRWIQQTLVGINICEKKRKVIGVSDTKAFIRAILSCKLQNSAMVMMTVQEKAQKYTYMTVLNKDIWETCVTPACTVTYVCTSSDEQDCKSIKGQVGETRRKAASTPRVSTQRIKYIAASSRYSNIIFGHGFSVMSSPRILSFNTSNNFAVSEHRLSGFIPKKRTLRPVTCGLTTGPCPTGEGSCVYLCYTFTDAVVKVGVFGEPHTDSPTLNVKCNQFDLSRRVSIISIAMTKNRVLYVLLMQSGITKIQVIIISTNYEGGFIKKKVRMVLRTHIHPTSLDKTKNGPDMLLVILDQMYRLSTGTLSEPYFTYQHLNVISNQRVSKSRVCLLSDGKHVAVINSKFPYKGRKIVFARRKTTIQ